MRVIAVDFNTLHNAAVSLETRGALRSRYFGGKDVELDEEVVVTDGELLAAAKVARTLRGDGLEAVLFEDPRPPRTPVSVAAVDELAGVVEVSVAGGPTRRFEVDEGEEGWTAAKRIAGFLRRVLRDVPDVEVLR